MSTSPSRYYDSKASRPDSPQNAAELRSQAVAKLKRAASLPRKTDGRRPDRAQSPMAPLAAESGRISSQGRQEILAATNSPVLDNGAFRHTPLQRSASAASSFHIPTPPHLAGLSQVPTPLFTPTGMSSQSGSDSPLLADLQAMQLAHSYLPSLSPVAIQPPTLVESRPPVSFNLAAPVGSSGRNTPSPLPTLGELRTLQRSNSAAARARAMDKLTGGRETPNPQPLPLVTLPRPGLQRADSLGSKTTEASSTTSGLKMTEIKKDHPPVSFNDTRPKLQRSFTVSSSNMGEERRSAVGRRMVARLGERRGQKETDVEEEVRKLWEQKTGRRDSGIEDDVIVDSQSGTEDEGDGGRGVIPDLVKHSPMGPRREEEGGHSSQNGGLGVPKEIRPSSRNTQVSEGDAFEFESHLRRSLSSRTARGAAGVTMEPALPSPTIQEVEQLEERQEWIPSSLGAPLRILSTPIKHIQQSSTSTGDTHSPGDSMRSASGDELSSMMFVLGGVSGIAPDGPKRETTGFPLDVDEGNTSSWGTPFREVKQPLQGMSHDSTTPVARLSELSPPEDNLTPPGISTRSSVMSWEEVGGDEDREVPSDLKYHKKSESITVKVKNAMRKRSQSRSSTSSVASPPTSPKSLGDTLSAAVQSFSRRGSSSSQKPLTSTLTPRASPVPPSPLPDTPDTMRHQPSMSSLSPSISEPSANSLLLQHQLSNDPLPISAMPRARMDDPRTFNSKLSPFPGIETRSNSVSTTGEAGTVETPPPLIHQASDSVVPSAYRATKPIADSHSLPLPPVSYDPSKAKRGSSDSISFGNGGKKNWLSRAFSSATSPRSSTSVSRKSSQDFSSLASSRRGSEEPPLGHSRQTNESSDDLKEPHDNNDPFAAPPPPVNRSRAISPSVSTVQEQDEHGHRMTQSTANRSRNQTPVLNGVKEYSEMDEEEHYMSDKSLEVLRKMDELLALAPENSQRPDVLDDPPRKLILATQVLQIVNENTAKDRFLLLFNDILVICKPILTHGATATLNQKFIVKSIVALDQLQASGFIDVKENKSEEKDALIADFIQRFKLDPGSACQQLIQQSRWKDGIAPLASTLLKTTELDKNQLGILLSSEDRLLDSFLGLFGFKGINIDDALRIIMLSIRLPGNEESAKKLLSTFAGSWHDQNQSLLNYQDSKLTSELVLAILQLNDSLHGGQFGTAPSGKASSPEMFISAFRQKDPESKIKDGFLLRIYRNIELNPLSQALTGNAVREERRIVMTPESIPNKMTYNKWSEKITISIRAIDENFSIELLGDGLEFDPPLLEFGKSKEVHFRFKGTNLGIKTVLFNRLGLNAPLYPAIGTARAVTIERAFMRHTFQISFSNHLGLKRKYCFSVPDSETRTKWGVQLPRQISITRQRVSQYNNLKPSKQDKIRQAAEVVALKVLRDALIPPTPTKDGRPKMLRSGSVSVTYMDSQGKGEEGLGALIGGKSDKLNGHYKETEENTNHGGLTESTGKELVLICRQNSLLPVMLTLLQAGVETKERNFRGMI